MKRYGITGFPSEQRSEYNQGEKTFFVTKIVRQYNACGVRTYTWASILISFDIFSIGIFVTRTTPMNRARKKNKKGKKVLLWKFCGTVFTLDTVITISAESLTTKCPSVRNRNTTRRRRGRSRRWIDWLTVSQSLVKESLFLDRRRSVVFSSSSSLMNYVGRKKAEKVKHGKMLITSKIEEA